MNEPNKLPHGPTPGSGPEVRFLKPRKATYSNVSSQFREDKKNEAIAGFLMAVAMAVSLAISFGHAGIAVVLFFLVYPAIG